MAAYRGSCLVGACLVAVAQGWVMPGWDPRYNTRDIDLPSIPLDTKKLWRPMQRVDLTDAMFHDGEAIVSNPKHMFDWDLYAAKIDLASVRGADARIGQDPWSDRMPMGVLPGNKLPPLFHGMQHKDWPNYEQKVNDMMYSNFHEKTLGKRIRFEPEHQGPLATPREAQQDYEKAQKLSGRALCPNCDTTFDVHDMLGNKPVVPQMASQFGLSPIRPLMEPAYWNTAGPTPQMSMLEMNDYDTTLRDFWRSQQPGVFSAEESQGAKKWMPQNLDSTGVWPKATDDADCKHPGKKDNWMNFHNIPYSEVLACNREGSPGKYEYDRNLNVMQQKSGPDNTQGTD